jgi:hypothetical protein
MRIAIRYVSEEGSLLLLDKINVGEAVKYALTINSSPSDKGNATGASQYYENQQVAVSASPITGYKFGHWANEEGVVLSTSANYSFAMPAADYTITAYFEPVLYNLVLKIDPANAGTVKGAGGYPFNHQVSAEAEPAEGFAFVRWINRDADEVSKNAVYNFAMPARSLELTAVFQNVTSVQSVRNDIRIYPNPVRELLHIETSGIIKKVIITDISGRQISFNAMQDGVIDVRRLQAGIYILQLYLDNEIYTGKIKIIN